VRSLKNVSNPFLPGSTGLSNVDKVEIIDSVSALKVHRKDH